MPVFRKFPWILGQSTWVSNGKAILTSSFNAHEANILLSNLLGKEKLLIKMKINCLLADVYNIFCKILFLNTGITNPNPEIQASLMKEIYSRSGVNVKDVYYVEAHGTGTQVNNTDNHFGSGNG